MCSLAQHSYLTILRGGMRRVGLAAAGALGTPCGREGHMHAGFARSYYHEVVLLQERTGSAVCLRSCLGTYTASVEDIMVYSFLIKEALGNMYGYHHCIQMGGTGLGDFQQSSRLLIPP